MRKKTVIFIILALTLNNLAFDCFSALYPHTSPLSSNVQETGASAEADVNRPLSIMNEYVKAAVPLYPEMKASSENNDTDNAAPGTNYFLLANNNSETKLIAKSTRFIENTGILKDIQKKRELDLYLFYMRLLLSFNGIFSFFLLLYFILLAQSNLPYEISRYFYRE